MKPTTLIVALFTSIASLMASAESVAGSSNLALLKGDTFKCTLLMPRPGVAVANTEFLTCTIDPNIKTRAGGNPLIQVQDKLIGRVHGQKVIWSSIVTAAGKIINLDTDPGSELLASSVHATTLPSTLTVHVIRDLAFN